MFRLNKFSPGCCCGPKPPPDPDVCSEDVILCVYVFDYHEQCADGEITWWPEGVDPDTLGNGIPGQPVRVLRTIGTTQIEVVSTTTGAGGKVCMTIPPLVANPADAISASLTGTGSTIAEGAYTFKYSWIDSTGNETAVGPASNSVTVTAAKEKITLDLPAKPANVSKARVYVRRNATGNWVRISMGDVTATSVTLSALPVTTNSAPSVNRTALGTYRVEITTTATPCNDIVFTGISFTALCQTIKKAAWLCCQRHVVNVIDHDTSDAIEGTHVACNGSTPDGEWHNVFGTCNSTDHTTDGVTHCTINETTEYFGSCGANTVDCNIPGFTLSESAPLHKRASAGGEWIKVCDCEDWDFENNTPIHFEKTNYREYIPKRLYVTFTGGAGPQAILGSYYNTPIAVDWLPDSSDGGLDKPGMIKFESACLSASGAVWYKYQPWWDGRFGWPYSTWDESSETAYLSAKVFLYLRNTGTGTGTPYVSFMNFYYAGCDPRIPEFPPPSPHDLNPRPAGRPWCLQHSTCRDWGTFETAALADGLVSTDLIASCAPFFYSVDYQWNTPITSVGYFPCIGCGYCGDLDCATEKWGITITE